MILIIIKLKKYKEDLEKIDNEIQRFYSDVNQFLNPNITAIVHRQMSELYEYFLETYKNNTRFEFLSFLLDKGIDANELFDERYEINFFVHNFRDNLSTGYLVDEGNPHDCCYDFNLLHSDGIQDLTHNKAIMVKYYIAMYVKWSGDKYPYIGWYGTPHSFTNRKYKNCSIYSRRDNQFKK